MNIRKKFIIKIIVFLIMFTVYQLWSIKVIDKINDMIEYGRCQPWWIIGNLKYCNKKPWWQFW
ncbi:MAG: hypothetical protein GX445_03430 [Elusimicrobia bacterium]|nr:hypothetical protein [Elusimicrobiota bacterium]